jgi:hypothetical protein
MYWQNPTVSGWVTVGRIERLWWRSTGPPILGSMESLRIAGQTSNPLRIACVAILCGYAVVILYYMNGMLSGPASAHVADLSASIAFSALTLDVMLGLSSRSVRLKWIFVTLAGLHLLAVTWEAWR